MGWTEDKDLKGWLSGLIECFQADDCRPATHTFSNLDELSTPTQILCLSIEADGMLFASAVITHEAEFGNGRVSVFRVTDRESLAAFADEPPADLHWRQVHTNPHFPKNWLLPSHDLATIVASELARAAKGERRVAGPLKVGGRTILQGTPSGTIWTLSGTTLSEPNEVLKAIGTVHVPQPAAAPAGDPAAPPVSASTPASERASAFATYADPPIWLGPPPFPSPGDVVRGVSTRAAAAKAPTRVVATNQVAGCTVYLSQRGLVIAEGTSQQAALMAINLVFASFLLCGLPATAASATDLLSITDFDHTTGEVRGSSGRVVLRNERFSYFPAFTEMLVQAFQVDGDHGQHLIDLAASYGLDAVKSAMAVRLLDTYTLLQRGHATEAFLIAWTIIEQWIGERFTDTWLHMGRSRRAIKAMKREWTASQQLDVLVATGGIPQADFDSLAALRRRRNDVVHGLQNASPEEAEQAINLAERFAGLPRIELAPRRFDLR